MAIILVENLMNGRIQREKRMSLANFVESVGGLLFCLKLISLLSTINQKAAKHGIALNSGKYITIWVLNDRKLKAEMSFPKVLLFVCVDADGRTDKNWKTFEK